jgi:hypothetical protein
VCNKQIPCSKKSQLTQHVETALHKNSLKRSENLKKQVFFVENKSKHDSFNEELCRSLVVANIPWNKLQVPLFREFLEKYTSRHIPDESTLSKNYLEPCYIQTISEIRKLVGDSKKVSCSRLTKPPILMGVILLIL